MRVINPYREVNWQKSRRCKSNFHCHTRLHKLADEGRIIPFESGEFSKSPAQAYGSDGPDYPHAVIDRYKAYGFDILAITDHDPFYGYGLYQESYGDRTVYPWTRWNRSAASMGMVAIEGKELTNPHGKAMEHDVSLFCSLGKTDQHETGYDRIERLEKTASAGGLLVLCHPRGHVTPEALARQASTHDACRLMEVFTRGASSDARTFWDDVLCYSMPGHPVWGVSCDDMHQFSQLGTNYSIHWLTALDSASVRRSLTRGGFYACMDPLGNDPKRHEQGKAPRIERVTVRGDRIRISCSFVRKITWISCGRAVDEGGETRVRSVGAKKYIRAELIGDQGAVALTQPFGIVES